MGAVAFFFLLKSEHTVYVTSTADSVKVQTPLTFSWQFGLYVNAQYNINVNLERNSY